MKKWSRMTVRIVVLAAFIVILALVVRDASHQFQIQKYNASASGGIKFKKMARWISPTAEFYVAVDTWRMLKDPVSSSYLMKFTGGRDGVAADFIRALLTRKESVGMLMLVGAFSEKKSKPLFAVVAGGFFDEQNIIPTVSSILREGNSRVISESVLRNMTIFYEEDGTDDPFGFMFLDGEHLAVGSRKSLLTLFSGVPSDVVTPGKLPDFVLWGQLKMEPRLMTFLPENFEKLSDITLYSADGKIVTLSMICSDQKGTLDARMFFEGIRSLVMLQNEENKALLNFLEQIRIYSEGTNVYLTYEIQNPKS